MDAVFSLQSMFNIFCHDSCAHSAVAVTVFQVLGVSTLPLTNALASRIVESEEIGELYYIYSAI